jgi:hypothetical protein
MSKNLKLVIVIASVFVLIAGLAVGGVFWYRGYMNEQVDSAYNRGAEAAKAYEEYLIKLISEISGLGEIDTSELDELDEYYSELLAGIEA